ncbi:MAG: HD domain-containing phosphohydrolase [Thermoanaerobacteraceae bacterium]
MFANYSKRLFFTIFGLTFGVYILSYLHFMSGFENKIIFGILIFIISIYSSFILSRALSKPLEELNKGVKKVAQGNFDYKINIKFSKEFSELSDNFNIMVRDLAKTYERFKSQTEILLKQNDELQEFNAELEASYEQLEALSQDLEASEKKYRLLVENILDILWVTDENLKIEFVNTRVLKFLGYTPQELIGRCILDITDDEGKNILKDMIMGKVNFAELRFIRKDGILVITETRIKRLKNEENVIGMQGVSRDITQMYTAKRQIAEKNKEILAIGDVGRILTSGTNTKEVLGKILDKIADILHSPLCVIRMHDKNQNVFDLLMAGGELKDYPVLKRLILDNEDVNLLVGSKEIIIKDLDDLMYDDKMTPVFREKEAYSLIIVPIISRNETIGTLNVWVSSGTVKNMSLMRSIASSVSVAIENSNLYEELKQWYVKTIEAIAYAVEAKDLYTKGHSIRVSQYAMLLGESMGLSSDKIEQLRIAGILHDVGKIGISDLILLKSGKLTEEEYNVIKTHPEIARKILSPIGFPKEIMDAISKHHERYDGKGYPYGIKGEEISIEAAILCLVDSFDAMTSDRAYKKGVSVDDAIDEILKNKGTQFNPEVVDAFISLYINNKEKLEEIKNKDFFIT